VIALGPYAYDRPMRRKTLDRAIQDPADVTNEVSTFGQAQPSDHVGDGSSEQSGELPTSGSARILDPPSGLGSDAYILRRRVERTLNLLKQESMTLARVLRDSEFDTEVQFVREFRAMIGVEPSIYRKRVMIAKSTSGSRTGSR
jgi:AraC-like DNA-binding protein